MGEVTVGARFEEALETLFGPRNNKKVAEKHDITQQAVGKLKTKTSLNETICSISEKEGINLNWLQNGKGAMLLNEIKNSPSDTVTVNLHEDVYAAAGYGADNDYTFPPIPVQISAEVLRDVFNVHSTKHVDIINVSGDSMEPFFHHGDRIIVERTHEASDNNIVIALVDGQLFVKRLLKDPLGRWVKLTSTNEFYPDIPLEGEEIDRLRIVGIVRGKWRPI